MNRLTLIAAALLAATSLAQAQNPHAGDRPANPPAGNAGEIGTPPPPVDPTVAPPPPVDPETPPVDNTDNDFGQDTGDAARDRGDDVPEDRQDFGADVRERADDRNMTRDPDDDNDGIDDDADPDDDNDGIPDDDDTDDDNDGDEDDVDGNDDDPADG